MSLCNWFLIFQGNVVPSLSEVDGSHSISCILPPPPSALVDASWCPLIPTASVLHSSPHLLILGPCLFQGTCIICRMVAMLLDFLPLGRRHLCYVLMIKPVTWLYPVCWWKPLPVIYHHFCSSLQHQLLASPTASWWTGNLSRQPVTGFTVPIYSCHLSFSDILLRPINPWRWGYYMPSKWQNLSCTDTLSHPRRKECLAPPLQKSENLLLHS